MALDKDGNVYTIAFATVMVVIVGGLLALVSNNPETVRRSRIELFIFI